MIERQIEDWRKRGIIDDALASTLRADYAENGVKPPWARGAKAAKSARRFSFFQVLIVFAAISFTAGIGLLIASNWEAIPRIVRAVGILSFIPIGLLGGYFVRGRFGARSHLVEEACYLIAAGAFLSSVALVAQMYHISGDGRSATLLYAAGLGFGALAVRSFVFTGGALILWASWHLDGRNSTNLLSFEFWAYFAALGAAFAFAIYVKSRWAKRAIILGAVAGILPLLGDWLWTVLGWIGDWLEWLFDLPQPVQLTIWWTVFLLACAALFVGRKKPNTLQKVPGFKRGWIGPQFTVALLALAVLHELNDRIIWANYAMTAVGIALAISVLWIYGAGHRLIRYACYILFVMEIYVLFGSSLASMVSTSGIFILLSILLVVIAAIVYRLEKRFAVAGEKSAEV